MKRRIANILRAISGVSLLLWGAVFGEGALESGKLPLTAIFVFVAIGLLFWIGEKLSPMR